MCTGAPAQKLRNLDALRALEVRYVPAQAYSMRLFAVRLAELLHCPRLARLVLAVPALHDATDGTVFLSHLFMAQLRACALRELDITLISDAPLTRPRSPGGTGVPRLFRIGPPPTSAPLYESWRSLFALTLHAGAAPASCTRLKG